MWDANIKSIVQRVLVSLGLRRAGAIAILIEVELLTEWVTMGGSVHLDAESGSFRVGLPHLILALT